MLELLTSREATYIDSSRTKPEEKPSEPRKLAVRRLHSNITRRIMQTIPSKTNSVVSERSEPDPAKPKPRIASKKRVNNPKRFTSDQPKHTNNFPLVGPHVAGKLRPYMIDPSVVHPTSITVMPVQVTLTHNPLQAVNGRVHSPTHATKKTSSTPAYLYTSGDFLPCSSKESKSYENKSKQIVSLPPQKLWEKKYQKSTSQHLVSFIERQEPLTAVEQLEKTRPIPRPMTVARKTAQQLVRTQPSKLKAIGSTKKAPPKQLINMDTISEIIQTTESRMIDLLSVPKDQKQVVCQHLEKEIRCVMQMLDEPKATDESEKMVTARAEKPHETPDTSECTNRSITSREFDDTSVDELLACAAKAKLGNSESSHSTVSSFDEKYMVTATYAPGQTPRKNPEAAKTDDAKNAPTAKPKKVVPECTKKADQVKPMTPTKVVTKPGKTPRPATPKKTSSKPTTPKKKGKDDPYAKQVNKLVELMDIAAAELEKQMGADKSAPPAKELVTVETPVETKPDVQTVETQKEEPQTTSETQPDEDGELKNGVDKVTSQDFLTPFMQALTQHRKCEGKEKKTDSYESIMQFLDTLTKTDEMQATHVYYCFRERTCTEFYEPEEYYVLETYETLKWYDVRREEVPALYVAYEEELPPTMRFMTEEEVLLARYTITESFLFGEPKDMHTQLLNTVYSLIFSLAYLAISFDFRCL